MPLTKPRPLTPKEVHVAIAVLGCVKTLIDDRLSAHARIEVTNTIMLEPEIFLRLRDWVYRAFPEMIL